MTKIVLIALLCTGYAFGQNPTAACGPQNIHFNVKLDKSRVPLPKPEPRKALVIFIQDLGTEQFGIGVHPTIRIGVDGKWVGAAKSNSYLPVSVNQGVHHVCINWDSAMLDQPVELAHLHAIAGAVYYLRWRILGDGNLLLAPVDTDEAQYQIGMFRLNVPTPRH